MFNKGKEVIIITENNAFQNIGKCLHKQCTSESEIDDFLQFCIEYIIYDKICIVGTVPMRIIQDTGELIESLRNDYKIKSIKFEEVKDNSKKANSLICDVAQELLCDIDEHFDEIKNIPKEEAFKYLPKLPKPILELIENTTSAVKEKKLRAFTEENLEASLFKYDSCLLKIINAEHGGIIEKILEFDKKDSVWNESMTLHLISKIRYLTNRNLARLNDQIFLPSVNRGRIDRQNVLIPNIFDEIIGEAENKYIQITTNKNSIIRQYNNSIGQTKNMIGYINMPSIIDYVINKGLGRPKEMMKIVSDLRQKFKPVREYIKKYGNMHELDNIKTLKEISEKLMKELDLKESEIPDSGKVMVNTFTAGINFKIFNVNYTKQSQTNNKQFQDPSSTNKRNKKLNLCVQAFLEVVIDKQKYKNRSYYDILKKSCYK